MHELAAWIPVGLLWVLTFVERLRSSSWISPGAFTGLFAATFVTIPMLLTDYPVDVWALWVILLFVGSFQIGTFHGESLAGSGNDVVAPLCRNQELRQVARRARRFSILFSTIAFAGSLYFVFWSFWRFDLPPTPFSFLELGHLWSVQRYEYGELEPWAVRLAIMWVYPGALLGGVAFSGAEGRRERLWCFVSFLPAFLVGTIVAARAGLLISAVCWLSAFLAMKHWQSDGHFKLFRKQFLVSIGLLLCSFVVLFLVLDAIRQFEGTENGIELSFDLPRLAKYAFGYLAGFSSWIHSGPSQSPTIGAYTFGGVLDLLGIHSRQVGLYEDYVTLPGGETTNIYMLLRGLIEDFSLGGALLLTWGFGLMVGFLSNRPRRAASVSVLILAGAYALVLWSPVVSVFTYNGPILAWLVAGVVLASSGKVPRELYARAQAQVRA
jgi:oligosaccharide repeat unit polymerase